jgi:iron complex transport system ATP-binding protein
MAETCLQLSGLTVAYGDQPVLCGVDLRVEAGEFVGVLGPNGSGKTTLLRAARGLTPARAGTVELFGRPVARWRDRDLARRGAVVPQRDESAFPFTVEETVLMGRSPHVGGLAFETAHDRAVAAAALEELDLLPLRGRVVTELSGGERQRTIVARALAQEPELLLLDEPTASLDIRHQVAVLGLLARRNRERGLTVVTVLHDLNLASLFCDRVVLLSEGRVHADGPTAEVVTYANVKAVYRTEVYVGVNELNGKVFMVPMEQR